MTIRTPGRHRGAVAAVAALLSLTAMAGCGGDGGSVAKSPGSGASSSSSTPSAASSATDAPQAAGEEMSPGEFSALLEAAVDKATTAHVAMDLGGAGRGEGDTDFTTSPPSLSMKLTMAQLGGEAEVRLVDGSVYVYSPLLGERWMEFSLDDPDSPLGALGSQLDPTRQLEAYGAAVTAATHHGQEDVDGQVLDHYTTVVDTKKLLEQLPSAGVADAQLPDTLQQEWWFDSDGRISGYSSDFGTGSEVEVTFADWGKQVLVEAPPTD